MLQKLSLLFVFLGTIFLHTSAQQKTFLRLYDLSGKKIARGHFKSITDSSILISVKRKIREIPSSTIGLVKTKRSFGHNMLIGVSAGALTGINIGVLSHGISLNQTANSLSQKIMGGFLFATTFGSITAVMLHFLKQSKTFTIEGKKENWIKFQTDIIKITSKRTGKYKGQQ